MGLQPVRRPLGAALPAACCAALAAGITAQGACRDLFSSGSSSSVAAPPPTIALASRYVLTTVSGQAPPRVIRQELDGTVTRVIADTLTLAPGPTSAGGTFDEVAVLGVSRRGQAEVVATTTARGVSYTRPSYNVVQFGALVGVNGPSGTQAVDATLSASATGAASFHVSVTAGTFVFAPR